MASTGVYALTRFTVLAPGDVMPVVHLSDPSQNAHGSLDSITVTNFFASIPVPVGVLIGTITVSTPAFTSTATWNAVGTLFVHHFVNITDTASAAGSLLADWQVGSVSKFSVSKAGVVTATTFVGNVTGNVTGNASGTAGSCTGLAATATALATPRAINGVNFDGTAPITVVDSAALPKAGGTMSGTIAAAGNLVTTPKLQAYTETVTTPAISSNVLTLDMSGSNVFRVACGANITTLTMSNVPATGQLAEFTLILDYSGAYTLTLPGAFHQITGGSAPSAGANSKTDTLTAYTTNGGTTWYYNIAQGAPT
jgi:hypothetical protein